MPPNPFSHIRSLLVPIDGTDAAFYALGIACDVARRGHARLHVLHVIEVPRSLALDAEMVNEVQSGDAILERAERIAGDYGLKVEGDLVQAREAGHAIVDEATERAVDVIVIGVDYHRPYGRFALGSLPDYLLEHAPAQVWVIRDRRADADGGRRPRQGSPGG